MKYVWLLLVIIGGVGIFLGVERFQVENTENFGGYPCFLCASAEPDFEVVVFSKAACLNCENAVRRAQWFCRLTGVTYGNTFYDDAEESFSKLDELGLMWDSDFLVVVLKDGAVLDTTTDATAVEQFLSETMKEASQL